MTYAHAIPATEDDASFDIDFVAVEWVELSQGNGLLFVDRGQAEKLIELLQSWLRGEIA